MMGLILASTASAATWVVDAYGGGDVLTVAEGAALLANGDTLEIREGTYDVEDVYTLAENVSVIGDGWERTILDGSNAKSMVLAVNAGAYIEGLTVRNSMGFGLIANDAIISSCAVLSNANGGIFSYSVSIFNSILALNLTGIQFEYTSSDISVENSLLIDNSDLAVGFVYHGYLEACQEYRFHHNLFIGSSVGLGPGDPSASCHGGTGATLIATNNIFLGMPTSWGNDYAWTAIFSNNVIGASTVEDCIWAGSDVTCTDNLVADPDFVTWSDDGDWTNDDFHLLFGSAGIDHGVSGVPGQPLPEAQLLPAP